VIQATEAPRRPRPTSDHEDDDGGSDDDFKNEQLPPAPVTVGNPPLDLPHG
jgi:hypothetical protein